MSAAVPETSLVTHEHFARAERVTVGYLAMDRVDVLIVAIFLSTLVSRGGLGASGHVLIIGSRVRSLIGEALPARFGARSDSAARPAKPADKWSRVEDVGRVRPCWARARPPVPTAP